MCCLKAIENIYRRGRRLTEQIGGHAEQRVHEVVRLPVPLHHVRLVSVVDKPHRLPAIRRHVLPTAAGNCHHGPAIRSGLHEWGSTESLERINSNSETNRSLTRVIYANGWDPVVKMCYESKSSFVSLIEFIRCQLSFYLLRYVGKQGQWLPLSLETTVTFCSQTVRFSGWIALLLYSFKFIIVVIFTTSFLFLPRFALYWSDVMLVPFSLCWLLSHSGFTLLLIHVLRHLRFTLSALRFIEFSHVKLFACICGKWKAWERQNEKRSWKVEKRGPWSQKPTPSHRSNIPPSRRHGADYRPTRTTRLCPADLLLEEAAVLASQGSVRELRETRQVHCARVDDRPVPDESRTEHQATVTVWLIVNTFISL